MSHKGTNWAIQQRGLPPATKLVLWHLCDRHNPDYGCFPSQAQLAYDAECSRSALNDHLARLEAAGLIRRERRIDPKTRKQQNTRYILGFEEEFAQEPCPEVGHGISETEPEHQEDPCPNTGHGAVSDFDPEPCPISGDSRVRNSDTNPVREPLREPVRDEEERASACSSDFLARLRLSLGVTEDGSAGSSPWWQDEFARRRVEAWLAMGLTEAEVLEVAEEHRRSVPEAPEGPKALDRAMGRAMAARDVVKSAPGAKRSRKDADPPASEADQLAFLADWVNSDRFIPASALSNTTRDKLLSRGLVTPDRMLARGFR